MSSDETTEHPVVNSLEIDLNTLGAFMEGGIVEKEDIGLIIKNIGMAPCTRKPTS